MIKTHIRSLAITVPALGLGLSAHAHHSDAGLDLDNVITIDGTVRELSWRNPHVYFTVAATDDAGRPIEWTVQMASVATVSRMGWSRDSLEVGDRVSVGAYPARDGRPYAKFLSIERTIGPVLPTSFDSAGEVRLTGPEATAVASSVAGRWMADPDQVNTYPGRIDGLTRALLTLTDKAQAAQAAYDENSAENPELRCIGRPTPAMIVYTDLYPLELEFTEDEQILYIRSQFMDQERIVYLDGREHPDASDRSHEGHSIGWWEDGTLVVDTRNFADNRSPYQNGIPSGARKHVIERYQLTESGTGMSVEFMLEDPEFIAAPMTHSRELVYVPDADMSPFNCDLDSTRRFLTR
jgi:hypothetical protein